MQSYNILLLVMMIWVISCASSKNEKVISLCPKSTYFLKSEVNKQVLNGKSDQIIEIVLPKKTQTWYYSFTAFNKESQSKKESKASLFEQVITLVIKKVSETSLLDLIEIENGDAYCDVYIVDDDNLKRYRQDESFKYFQKGSREGLMNGKVEFPNPILDHYYIIVKNPKIFSSIKFNIEAIAILK